MQQLLLIPICLAIGFLLQKNSEFKKTGPALLNYLIIHLCLPALILGTVPGIFRTNTLGSMIFPALMPWLLFFGAMIFVWFIGQAFSWDREKTAAMTLAAGLGNTSFMGIPLTDAIYGSASLPTVMILDQLGSFLVLSTLASIYGAAISHGKLDLVGVAKRMLVYPPFLALMAALILVYFPAFDQFNNLLGKLGSPLVPLAVVSCGMQITVKWDEVRSHARELISVLAFKMFLFPAAILFLYVFAFGQQGFETQVTITEAAMAPMFSAAIIATRFHLKPRLVSLVIFVGVVLSLITVPLWAHFIRWI